MSNKNRNLSRKKRVVILGARGMLGHIVYSYLTSKKEMEVFGTDRSSDNYIFFDANTFEKSYATLKDQVGAIDYIINCIGVIVQNEKSSIEDFIRINALFPNQLARKARKNSTKVIHISSDAVFSPNSEVVKENDQPSPHDVYSCSKYLSESDFDNIINIRTSIIGRDHNKKRGLIEWVFSMRNKTVTGHTNQRWSGCTTLQYAQFCHYLISKSLFNQFRKKGHVVHFAPLKASSKYSLIKDICATGDISCILRRVRGKTITRTLKSNYERTEVYRSFSYNIVESLKKLYTYEEKLKY